MLTLFSIKLSNIFKEYYSEGLQTISNGFFTSPCLGLFLASQLVTAISLFIWSQWDGHRGVPERRLPTRKLFPDGCTASPPTPQRSPLTCGAALTMQYGDALVTCSGMPLLSLDWAPGRCFSGLSGGAGQWNVPPWSTTVPGSESHWIE